MRRDAETESETESEEVIWIFFKLAETIGLWKLGEIRFYCFNSQEVEQADIETQESVIRVVSPTDVQFKLDDQDKEEVQ